MLAIIALVLLALKKYQVFARLALEKTQNAGIVLDLKRLFQNRFQVRSNFNDRSSDPGTGLRPLCACAY